VEADEVRLQQIFWNVMRNAIRFTPSHGRIMIRSHSENPGWCRVEISDSGMGIETSEMERIFSPFEQGAGGHRFGGLGLGLAISRRLADFHGGRITATSKGRNQGAMFTIHLPVTPARSQGTPKTSLSPSRITHPKEAYRVLLVEDHNQTRSTLARLLTQRGHEVETAASIEQALQCAQTFAFNLLLSDLGLPDGSGHDLVKELRLKRPGFRGIALSGYGMESDIRQSLEAGFQAHLTKPVDTQALEKILNQPSDLQA